MQAGRRLLESKEPRLAADTEDPLAVLTAFCPVLDAMVFWARRCDVAEDTEEKEAADDEEVRPDPEEDAMPAAEAEERARSAASSQMFLATVWLQDQRPPQSHWQAYWEHPRVSRKAERPG